jgi:acetylglutamate kinase
MLVVKYGGHALPSQSEMDPVLEAIGDAFVDGDQVVLIHGGGPQIDAALKIRGLGKERVSGYRVTTPEVFQVVQSVLCGEVQRSIVNYLIGSEVNAVGITAGDGGLVLAKRLMIKDSGKELDIGLVGEVVEVNPEILKHLLKGGFLPVVTPLAVDVEGNALNINADLVAGAIGGALQADQVVFLTDVDGIFADWPNTDSLIAETNIEELSKLLPTLSEGMIPKVTAVLNAVNSGAKSARIVNGTKLKSVLDAFSGVGGTVVYAA